MTITIAAGLSVRVRGERFTVTDVQPLATGGTGRLARVSLRGLDGELRGTEIVVLHPIDPVEADTVPELSLSRIGRLAKFRLLHDVFRLRLSPPGDLLVGAARARIRFEPYQYASSAESVGGLGFWKSS
jgi:hypothetical protein